MTFLRWHLGMGDALLCCGLVRALVAQGRPLALPCYDHNRPSVAVLFEDLIQSGQVKLVGAYLNSDARPAFCEDELTLGYHGRDFDDTRFDWSFYQQAGVPFMDKWERFKVGGTVDACDPEISDGLPFVHDDRNRNYFIHVSGFRPCGLPTIFHYARIMEEALEVHCINSSFAIYADLCGHGSTRTLHRYARPDGAALPVFGRKWEIRMAP